MKCTSSTQVLHDVMTASISTREPYLSRKCNAEKGSTTLANNRSRECHAY